MSLRSALGRVRGLGSAKDGTHHWWVQRLTAVALVPLSLWFVAALVSMSGADHATLVDWIRSPVVTTLLVLLLVAVFYHAQLGMQVVFEDYIHTPWLQVTVQVLLRFACAALGLTAVLAVLRIALGAA